MDREQRQARVFVVSVHYRSGGRILELLNCLRWQKGSPDAEIIIVDNSSGEEELARIRDAVKEFSNVELLVSPTNRGYFGGARFAFDHYLERGDELPDWLIVCNHDVLIEDAEFFEKLFQLDPRSAGVIAPRIRVSGTNLDQNPFMRHRPNWLRWASLRFIHSNYGLAAFWCWLSRQKQALRSHWGARRSKTASMQNGRGEFIYAPHGAFFIFSRRYFEAGGYLDGNLFLYGEEISVAEICRSLGLPIIYEPSLRVLHKEHQSTGKRLSRFTYKCQKRALQYLSSRYWSGSQRLVGSCQPDLTRDVREPQCSERS